MCFHKRVCEKYYFLLTFIKLLWGHRVGVRRDDDEKKTLPHTCWGAFLPFNIKNMAAAAAEKDEGLETCLNYKCLYPAPYLGIWCMRT